MNPPAISASGHEEKHLNATITLALDRDLSQVAARRNNALSVLANPAMCGATRVVPTRSGSQSRLASPAQIRNASTRTTGSEGYGRLWKAPPGGPFCALARQAISSHTRSPETIRWHPPAPVSAGFGACPVRGLPAWDQTTSYIWPCAHRPQELSEECR